MASVLLIVDSYGNPVVGGGGESLYKAYIMESDKYPIYVFRHPNGDNVTLGFSSGGCGHIHSFTIPISVDENRMRALKFIGKLSYNGEQYDTFTDINRPRVLKAIRFNKDNKCYDFISILGDELGDKYSVFKNCILYAYDHQIIKHRDDVYIIATDRGTIEIYKNQRLCCSYPCIDYELMDVTHDAIRDGIRVGDGLKYLGIIDRLARVAVAFGEDFVVAGRSIANIFKHRNIDYDRVEEALKGPDVAVMAIIDTNLVYYQLRQAVNMINEVDISSVDRELIDGVKADIAIHARADKRSGCFAQVDMICQGCDEDVIFTITNRVSTESSRCTCQGLSWVKYVQDLLYQVPLYKVLSRDQLLKWARFIKFIGADKVRFYMD